jgi:predicted PurR-regulated permease PerM
MPAWLGTPAQRYRALLIVVAVLITLAVIRAASTALLPFILGFILLYLFVPVVNFLDDSAPRLLQRWNISRPLAILLLYLVGIGAIAGMMAFFIPALVSQAAEFGKMLPDYIEQMDHLLRVDMRELLDRVPAAVSDAIENAVEDAARTLGEAVLTGIEGTVRTLWQTLSFILGIVIIPFWLFYVLNDSYRFQRSLRRMIPSKVEPDLRNIVIIIDGLLGAYIRGQLILCLVVGLMSTALLLAFRIRLALLLGTMAGIFEIIPFLGPWLGAIPAVLIAFLRSPATALWVALGFVVIQQIESNLLAPRISGGAVRFHPAVVMILVIVGSEVAGLFGVLVAVPVAAVVRDVFQYLYLRTTDRGATPEMAMATLRARTL